MELGRANKDIVVCDADLSKSTMTHRFPKGISRPLLSCGIAEANMVAIGAGLASSGKIPFVSSFSVFVMNKGFEQLRVTAAYPHVNVKVVGTHSGISIGEDGPSQMSIEETSLACSLAGFVVMSPADEVATKAWCTPRRRMSGPVFIRTGRLKAPIIYAADQKFEIGKAIEVADGTDVTIIATGLLVAQAMLAADTLEAEGISARVIDMHTVKPLDRDAIQQCGRNRRHRGGGRASGDGRLGRARRAGGGGDASVRHGICRHRRTRTPNRASRRQLLEKVRPDGAQHRGCGEEGGCAQALAG